MTTRQNGARVGRPKGTPKTGGRQKGTPKTGGRKKGTPNKVTVDAQRAASEIVDNPAYRENLKQACIDRTVPPVVEVLLWNHAKGKPSDTLALKVSSAVSEQSDAELKARALAIVKTLDDE